MKKFFLWIYLFFHSWLVRIGIAMSNTETEVLKANPNDLDEKNKHNQKVKHKNPLLNKMEQGQKDEKYVQDFYEVLKKADKFMKTATPEQIEMAADKHNVITYGKKDKWGRRYEHYGFFDPKHKNYGKTMAEAMKSEVEERMTKDDDYPIEFMFKNEPSVLGFVGNNQIVVTDKGYESLNEYEKTKLKKFPLKIVRDIDVVNKLEQLTEFLHIKKVSSKHRIMEFFIPAKYGVFNYAEDSDIYKEIITADQVWIRDEYGNPYGYKVTEYYKRTEYINEKVTDAKEILYCVIKLKGTVIEKID